MMKKAMYDMLYLAACAINEVPPRRDLIDRMEADKLYLASAYHGLTSMIAMSLLSAGVEIPQEWFDEKENAIRNAIMFDFERAQIVAFLEEKGIRYMLMKGILLKDLYPQLGMRQMADNDILYDVAYQQELYKFMTKKGYSGKSIGVGAHDSYYKKPIYNFEMHTAMFGKKNEKLAAYYADVWSRLQPVEGSACGYRFTDEDYYVHIVAHEYKHFSGSGTGLRSLTDRYVYLTHKPDLNFAYIEGECKKLGIAEFERATRALCLRVFAVPADHPAADLSLPTLSGEDRRLLENYLYSGTYGTEERTFQNYAKSMGVTTGETSKGRYYLHRIFPPMEIYKANYAFCYKTRVLIPFAWAHRLVKGVFTKRESIKREIDTIKKI